MNRRRCVAGDVDKTALQPQGSASAEAFQVVMLRDDSAVTNARDFAQRRGTGQLS
jgi:hypothetical protein